MFSAGLFDGLGLSLHVICICAVKLSVESVVEYLVSKYEQHFTKSRQLEEEHAMQEMEIAKNGHIFVRACPVINGAMAKHWDVHNNGRWHFWGTSDNVKTTEGTEGRKVSKLLREKSKFPYEDI